MKAGRPGRLRLAVASLALAGFLCGCASIGASPSDPLEPINRAVFSFNEGLDNAVLKPVARTYQAALPEFVRIGVSNFFSNLDDLWIGLNNVMQGKVGDGVQDWARFVFNSTFGVLGFFDISSDFNLPKHNEDLGQTLGRWGVGSGAYLVLPLFGPSSLRDGSGLVVDSMADVVRNLDHVPTRNTLYTTRLVNTRANLLDTTTVLEGAALDKYRFIRDAYFQRRRNLIYDGNPPREKDAGDDKESALPAEPPHASAAPAAVSASSQWVAGPDLPPSGSLSP
jgi:phospholipid-binding lipoprotein MlaA